MQCLAEVPEQEGKQVHQLAFCHWLPRVVRPGSSRTTRDMLVNVFVVKRLLPCKCAGRGRVGRPPAGDWALISLCARSAMR